MSRFFKGLLLALLVTVFISSPVLAYMYRASLTIVESAGTAHSMLAANVSANIDFMEANWFIGENGTDTVVETLSGDNKPHMLATDRIMTATPIGASSQVNLYFTTGETPLSDFYIIPGYGGYGTITDAANIELGDNFTINYNSSWFNTSNGTDKNIWYKPSALTVAVSPTTSGNISASIPAVYHTETLALTGNGIVNQANILSGAATHWEACLADDAAYIGTGIAADKLDLFTAENGHGSGIVDNVTVTVMISQTNGWTLLRTHATNYAGTAGTGTRSTTYTTNPNTGNAWTWTEIADMEIGVGLNWAGGGNVLCDYVYATVNYHYAAINTTITGVSSGEHDLTVALERRP